MDDSRSNGPGPNLDGPSRPARDRLKYFFPTLVNLQPQEPPGTATRPHVEDLPIINVQFLRSENRPLGNLRLPFARMVPRFGITKSSSWHAIASRR
eukprot:3216494-Rhodomonas_salina.1